MTEADKLALLKDLLLTDDRAYAESIHNKIKALEQIINEQKKLSNKVDPIIDNKLEEFIEEIPETLGPTITEALAEQIKNSKDQVVEALYPIMGKMIKKYISQEISLLSERINKQLEDSFSTKSWKRKFKSWFGGVKEEELLLSELNAISKIEQVLVIEKNSGLLIGQYAKTETIDKDMVSGMLTAIKSFVEDAFQGKSQNLELIEYELYHIHIQSFVSFYVAVAISGEYNLIFKNKLQDIIFNFTDNFLNLFNDLNEIKEEDITNELEFYFSTNEESL
ncbi:cell envelope biogenesis protein OmpA [Kordia sp.]|uniref:cell envelope biogenesis protein OmpA n=1 Tax=Kordia sp. TaxID=1965332 RepID=UPI0025B9C2AA|nr:cell envelope biogenesis protein OmpA [Kordia sp.]MCH2192660.1 cell envelope biogenesis protein OmpA [Kordia sp.]